ncbi:MAG: hypothetical protein EAZ43_04135 [Betaproteobacteria bacterium]|nr:MAG: hypothetical protein EAZ43_04135 [Betaproteobacteria bacterium]
MNTRMIRWSAGAMAALTFGAAIAAENIFPKRSRTLLVKQPVECTQWAAPLPATQSRAEYPDDARGLHGDAALLLRIGADGSYQGLLDFVASDEAYVRAAEKAVKQWTFVPAQCNGTAIASDARVDFTFRREGAITYKTGASSFSR